MKTNKDFFQLKRCQFVKNQWPVLVQMTELLIYFQTMCMFLHSPLLWAGDAVENPRAGFIHPLFSSLNLQLSFFTANTKSNPKITTDMNCWTGAGTEMESGAAPRAESCQTLSSSRNVGAQGDSVSFLLSASPERCRHAVPSSVSLLRTCLQRLPRAFHSLLWQFEGSHLCFVLFLC